MKRFVITYNLNGAIHFEEVIATDEAEARAIVMSRTIGAIINNVVEVGK